VSTSDIEVIGADANNLKCIDVRFPLNQISVVTGVSGSGKSSLLVDTIAAEGSRRLSTFLGISQDELERDDVRAFIGALPPTVLVGQRGFRPTVRTTVATATGFLSILRRLFVLASTPYSEPAKARVPSPSADSYAFWIANHFRGKAELFAVPVRQQHSDGVSAVRRLAAEGINQVTVYSEGNRRSESGNVLSAAKFKPLNANTRHTIEAVVGEVDVRGPAQAETLRALLDRAFRASNAHVVVMLPGATDPALAGPYGPRLDSGRHWLHPADAQVYARPSDHLLSFNAPEHEESGACPECKGTGTGRQLREDALIAHPERSMHEGAFAIWTQKNYKYVNVQHETIEGLRDMREFSPDVAWSRLPTAARELVLNGTDGVPVFDRDTRGRKIGDPRPFVGFRKIILDKAARATKASDQLAAYVSTGVCRACDGTRWSTQARALRVGNVGVADILAMPFGQVTGLADPGTDFAKAVPRSARFLAQAIGRQGHALQSVGLNHLTGDRGMLQVSEGESRRVRLARILEPGERGLCLLLDEPARGLHEADLPRLVSALETLRGEHTVILNEHRERLWNAADWHVEIGPGAGRAGGEVTYAGRPRKKEDAPEVALLRSPLPVAGKYPQIAIRGAAIHNVIDLDCEIPLGRLTCICGVSGSGKTNFIRGILAPALQQYRQGASDFAMRDGRWRSVSNSEAISELIALDQVSPPRNRRSLVATYTEVFDRIRRVFASAPLAKREGLTASDFGLNTGNGRCQTCLGVGEIADGELWAPCPACGGTRFAQSVLSVRVADVNVSDLLDTPVADLKVADAFQVPPRLIRAMCQLGIGHIALGRRIDSLSGGEIQRLRLAISLSTSTQESKCFILDEPAVGLHPQDVALLASALDSVVDAGRNTVVMVEHDLRLIRSADWVIEFGPGSGPQGGQIVFAGTPAELVTKPTPTGFALAGELRSETKQLPFAERKLEIATSTETQWERTRSLLRGLTTGDTSTVAAADDTPGALVEPVVLISDRLVADKDSWEVVGLDREFPKLLLDLQFPVGVLFDDVLSAWRASPDCWLAIQPFLTQMQIWGPAVPNSEIKAVSGQLSREGLCMVTTKRGPVSNDFDVRSIRATGDRFVPADDGDDARLRAVRDAFAVGARYVELRDRGGELRATASSRLLDLEAGLIAPMVPVPPHFTRHESMGRCPMCSGRRRVTVLPNELLIADLTAVPTSQTFLTSSANEVLRGVLRNNFTPFFRRLAEEGLWDLKKSFDNLSLEDRDVVLFGFWSRPGPGSFLKERKSDPAEVSSWLRWDGLYRHLLAALDRSRDTSWVRQVREGVREETCFFCQASGLQRFAELLSVGDVSFPRWTTMSDAQGQAKLLSRLKPRTERQRRTLDRLLHCLTPTQRETAQRSAEAVIEKAVDSFTTMRAVRLPVNAS
jgi:excinuclease ABC A subunit